MEITSKFKERETHSPLNSPSSHHNNGSSHTSTSTTTNGVGIPITRSDPNSPYPTTFVTADTTSFKQVVQMLTGSSEPGSKQTQQPQHQNQHQQQQQSHSKSSYVIPPIRTAPKKQGFKLYERRNSALKNMMISPLTPNSNNSAILYAHHHQYNHHTTSTSFSPRNKPPEILSPSILDFPSLTLSPVTPLVELDPFDKSSTSSSGGRGSSASSSSEAAEERAIAEKGFYLHPSPISTPRDSEPQLLPLFPLTSPRD